MRQVTAIVCLTLIAGVCAQPVLAKKPDWAGQGKQEHALKESKRSAVEKVESDDAAERFDGAGFSSYERARIRGYFLEGDDESRVDSKGQGIGKDKSRLLPRGLQKKLVRDGELPPDLQKKVAAGGVLGEELYEGSEALPDDLDLILNRTGGAEYRRIGTKVIKVLEGDGTIIDVIDIADGVLSGSTE